MSAKLHLRDKYTERQEDKRACQLRPFVCLSLMQSSTLKTWNNARSLCLLQSRNEWIRSRRGFCFRGPPVFQPIYSVLICGI